ncbi:MAG: hypothetical protein ABEJ91_01600 [Candidatus Nanohaloarchaea archaeon]
MLSPNDFAALEPQGSGGGEWEGNDYSSDPAYGEVDSTTFSYVFDDHGSGQEQQVVTDGGEDVETLADVDHTPPDWTDMDNPTI